MTVELYGPHAQPLSDNYMVQGIIVEHGDLRIKIEDDAHGNARVIGFRNGKRIGSAIYMQEDSND